MMKTHCRGFSLIEVTLALGLAAFCLTTLLGLIPLGLISNHRSNAKCSAADVACLLISDLKNASSAVSTTGTGQAVTVDGYFKIPATGAGLTGTTAYYTDQNASAQSSGTANHFAIASGTPPKGAQYLVSVSMQPPTTGHAATNVDIRISWPAQASPANAEGMLEVFTALDRN